MADFGCGSGRNTWAISECGYQVLGIDYNEENLKRAKQNTKRLTGKNVECVLNTSDSIPLESNSIDCFICWGALFYTTEKDRQSTMNEINRVLKKGGLILANWRGTDDFFYGKGAEIENNVFTLDERAKAFGLENITYYFASKSDLEELYKNCGFEIYNIEKKVFTINNMQVNNSHWHIWARKI